jgi:MarR family transcriptional regulator, 2-MHQ and catechol-resistance regulon repressor
MDQDTAVSLKLWVVMSRAMRSIQTHLERQVERHGLNLTEFAVLEVLLHKKTLRIGEIGDRVLLTTGSMTYVIDKLERRGLLKRVMCETDRRAIYAELTDEGRALIEMVFPEHAQTIRALMEGVTLEEKEQVITLLKRLGLYARQTRAHLPDHA